MASKTLTKKADEIAAQGAELADPVYKMTPEEDAVVSGVFSLFTNTRQERDLVFEYFDDRNLITYIDDSVKRYTTNVDIREDIEDWQSVVHVPFTRNKVNGVLGKVVDALPVSEYGNRGDDDLIKAEILNSLSEHADQLDDVEELFVYALEEAIVKGTCVVYEGFETKTKNKRDVIRYKDGDEVQVKNVVVKTRRLQSHIIDLEEFYPGSVGIRKVEDMPYCFVRQIIPFSKFSLDYSNFERAKHVLPYSSSTTKSGIDQPFYKHYVTNDTGEGNVEIIKYYNQDTDEFILTANGIWLNPINSKWDTSPIPFNHKKLPFWIIRYDIFGNDFFYGKSLPDKLKSLQDVMNVLQNMLLDQSFLTIFKPILVAGFDDIEDDFLRPGRRIPVDTNGLPIDQAYKELDMSTPSGWHQFILEYTKRILEESSMDSVSQGIAGVGGRTTATEIRSAAAGVVSLIGLFAKFIKFGMKSRARLRGKNILQFYTDPSNPLKAEAILGQDGGKEMSKAFNTIEVDSSAFTPGRRGTKIIEIYANKADLPTKKQNVIKKVIGQATSGKKVTRISVHTDYIRNFEFDVKLVPNPKSDFNQDVERALEVQFQQTMNTIYPDLIDRPELAAQLIEKFGRDPSKVLRKDVLEKAINPPPPENQTQDMVPPMGGDNSANTVKGATGVGGEALATRDLQNSMM